MSFGSCRYGNCEKRKGEQAIFTIVERLTDYYILFGHRCADKKVGLHRRREYGTMYIKEQEEIALREYERLGFLYMR